MWNDVECRYILYIYIWYSPDVSVQLGDPFTSIRRPHLFAVIFISTSVGDKVQRFRIYRSICFSCREEYPPNQYCAAEDLFFICRNTYGHHKFIGILFIRDDLPQAVKHYTSTKNYTPQTTHHYDDIPMNLLWIFILPFMPFNVNSWSELCMSHFILQKGWKRKC